MGDKLRCPHCRSFRHHRINSRRYKAKRLADLNTVARAHRCDDCHKEWVTVQTPLLGEVAKAILEVLGE